MMGLRPGWRLHLLTLAGAQKGLGRRLEPSAESSSSSCTCRLVGLLEVLLLLDDFDDKLPLLLLCVSSTRSMCCCRSDRRRWQLRRGVQRFEQSLLGPFEDQVLPPAAVAVVGAAAGLADLTAMTRRCLCRTCLLIAAALARAVYVSRRRRRRGQILVVGPRPAGGGRGRRPLRRGGAAAGAAAIAIQGRGAGPNT